jgi:hypothetical protein
VVVAGGLGSLAGAFITSLLIGMMQTFAVALDVSLASLGLQVPFSALAPLARLTLAQVAPVLPYLLLVVMLVVRPKGLMGRREGLSDAADALSLAALCPGAAGRAAGICAESGLVAALADGHDGAALPVLQHAAGEGGMLSSGMRCIPGGLRAIHP